MEEVFLDSIPFKPDFESLTRRLHLKSGSPHLEDFSILFNEMAEIARPKAFYKVSFIDESEADSIVINGVCFHSRVLCVNLADVHRVFAYVATCGREIADKRAGETDILSQFWADAVMESALQAAMAAMMEDMNGRYQLAKTSAMNPGSLPDWPITQQRAFFDLLGSSADRTGVRLLDSMLMTPSKSTTGIIFETESNFVNCQLCPRRTCPNRRAGYNPELFDTKYRQP